MTIKRAHNGAAMNRRAFVPLLIAVWLFLGQCAAVIHATEHELSAKAQGGCAICAIAHSAAGAPITAHAVVHPFHAVAPLPSATRPPAAQYHFARPYRTGPPALLI